MESPLSALKHKVSKGVTPKITESPPPVSGARAKAGAGLEPDAGPPGTRPNIGQTEEPRGNIKKVSETEKPASDLGENLAVTTPMVSAAESPLVSRTTESSPNLEGSVDRNSAPGAKKQGSVRKDARNFTFNEAEAKKIEGRLYKIQERTPKPQPSSSRTDGTSAAPQPKKSGPKRTQPASQLWNLQPKNKKNFTFDDKKVEDIRSRNQELRERLKRIKKRKLPSDMQAPLQLYVQGINQPRRAFHWCVRLHEDNLSSWHCVDILLNPLRRTARIGGLRRQDEVPSIIPTVGSVCPPPRTDEHNLFSENRSLTREKEHECEAVEAFNNLECEKHGAALKEEVPKETVKELSIEECESSHDKEFFASDEASEVNYNAPKQRLSEEVNWPIAGPNLHAPPASEHRQEEELPNSNRNDGPNYTLDTIYAKMNRVGEELDTLIQQRQTENQKEIIQQPISEVYNEPSASGTNDGSIGVVKSIAPTVSSVCLSSRTGESQSLRKKEHEVGATEAYGNQEYDGKTSVEKNSQNDGSSLAPPKHMKFSEKELPRSENQNLMNTNRYRNCEELLDKVRDTISLLNTQGKASLESSNPQNHGSSSAPPHYKKCSEKELPPSENRILMDTIWRIYCDELYEKVREIFPHLNIQGRTSLGPSNPQYHGSSSVPPEYMKFCEEEVPPSENRVMMFIIKAFGGCKRWYGYCKELLQKVREMIPLLSTQTRGGTKGEHVPLNEELYYELGLDVQAGSGSSGWTTDEENSSSYVEAEELPQEEEPPWQFRQQVWRRRDIRRKYLIDVALAARIVKNQLMKLPQEEEPPWQLRQQVWRRRDIRRRYLIDVALAARIVKNQLMKRNLHGNSVNKYGGEEIYEGNI
ncbi:hypothetical protein AAG570_007369 [Ranatra chinensis]|uniref:Uncharacterized protein n=1 Tax=Ranatra chinensis TaxID=642074 RepID=A0ABD0YE70_9HEMI